MRSSRRSSPQTDRAKPIEKAWAPTRGAGIISLPNLDLAIASVLYLAAIALAVGAVIAFCLFDSHTAYPAKQAQ